MSSFVSGFARRFTRTATVRSSGFCTHACVLGSLRGPTKPRAMSFNTARRLCSPSQLPPFVEIPMPRLVPTMNEGVLSKWLVAEGDELQPGDLLCEVDVVGLNEDHKTDTLTLLIESHEMGYVARLLVPEGSKIRVDHPIGVMVEEEEHTAAFEGYTPPSGPSRNSGAAEKAEDGRLFCWQAYLKEE